MRRTLPLLLLAACSTEAGLVECPPGAELVGGICRPRCTTSAECLPGEVCLDNACVPGKGDAGEPDRDAATKDADPGDTGPRDSGVPDLGVMTCTGDLDCGRPMASEWGDCMNLDDECDESGTASRTIMRPRCMAGRCQLQVQDETMPCMVPREGLMCGEPEVGQYGECEWLDDCVETGLKYRSVTQGYCKAGRCDPETDMESAVCTRSTGGDPCPPYNDTALGPCEGPVCGGSGFQEVFAQTWACDQGRCTASRAANGITQTCTIPPAPDNTACPQNGVCCGGSCEPRDTNANCGACNIACTNNRTCAQIGPAGNPRYVCTCESAQECGDYGSFASCEFNIVGSGICSCNCIGPTSPCAGQCESGQCYETALYGYCAP